jgi:hypothetical protein
MKANIGVNTETLVEVKDGSGIDFGGALFRHFQSAKRIPMLYKAYEAFIKYDKNSIAYFAIRDFFWGVTSIKGFGFNLKPTASIMSQFLGQCIWSSIPVLGSLACHKIISKVTQLRISVTAAPAAISTCLVIPAWFWACEAGKKVGAWLNFSPTNAKYFAGLFTGVAEGVGYELLSTITLLCLSQDERDKFNADPIGYWENLKKNLLCSATIGAIPGALWQIMAVVCEVKDLDAFLGGLYITLVVLAANFTYDQIREKISLSDNSQNIFGNNENCSLPPEGLEDESEEEETPSYNLL